MREALSVRGLLVVLLATALAGCVGPGDTEAQIPPPLTSLAVYQYRYNGDDAAFPSIAYGWMARITNLQDQAVAFVVRPAHANATIYGVAGNTSWEIFDRPTPDIVSPGESRLYLFQATFTNATTTTGFTLDVLESPMGGDEGFDLDAVTEQGIFLRGIEWHDVGLRMVDAGHHVLTATAGVWLNGTSFYTNIPALNDDPVFPAGYDRSEFDGTPLPIYVYDQDRTEQPAGSKDTCRFTTIPGYNALLKTQAEAGTSVRWLAPEEAYTRPGAEEHSLYGDVLVFLNTVVLHEGAVTPAQSGPQPTGDCFQPNNSSPVPLPPIPPLS